MSKLSERLRTARTDKGMTQIDLAKKSGVSQSTISDIERGRNESSKELPDLARALGCSIDYLAGAKPQKPAENHELIPVIVWDAPEDLDPEHSVIVPRVNVKFAAGNGHIASFEPQMKAQGNAYRMDWIRFKKLDPKKLICVYVSGDSMFPTMRDGSLMTTDTRSDTLASIVPGKVYAIRYGNELRVKRLSWRFDGALLIDSDNPAYPREVVEPQQLEHIGVIGCYVGHSYDGEI